MSRSTLVAIAVTAALSSALTAAISGVASPPPAGASTATDRYVRRIYDFVKNTDSQLQDFVTAQTKQNAEQDKINKAAAKADAAQASASTDTQSQLRQIHDYETGLYQAIHSSAGELDELSKEVCGNHGEAGYSDPCTPSIAQHVPSIREMAANAESDSHETVLQLRPVVFMNAHGYNLNQMVTCIFLGAFGGYSDRCDGTVRPGP